MRKAETVVAARAQLLAGAHAEAALCAQQQPADMLLAQLVDLLSAGLSVIVGPTRDFLKGLGGLAALPIADRR
jgi:hypothetical protein